MLKIAAVTINPQLEDQGASLLSSPHPYNRDVDNKQPPSSPS